MKSWITHTFNIKFNFARSFSCEISKSILYVWNGGRTVWKITQPIVIIRISTRSHYIFFFFQYSDAMISELRFNNCTIVNLFFETFLRHPTFFFPGIILVIYNEYIWNIKLFLIKRFSRIVPVCTRMLY